MLLNIKNKNKQNKNYPAKQFFFLKINPPQVSDDITVK